ncbi:MAG TPA: hypothetical protein PLY40_07320 [Bacillota bacterium]|nr:hypothetical protein [Bacillota bacterium]
MPFVIDVYPPAGRVEAVAGLALALTGRKGRGFPGKRQYEELEVLGRFFVRLRTVTWDRGDGASTALLVDPQGLTGSTIRFDLAPTVPGAELREEPGEEDFIALCRQLTKDAASYTTDVLEIAGLVSEPGQAMPLLDSGEPQGQEAGLDQVVDAAQVLERLRRKLGEYDNAAAAWTELKQRFLAFRDRQVEKIRAAAEEDRLSGSKALEELQQQVKAAIASRSQEIEEEREKAKQDYQKQKELLQSEIDRFRQQYQDTGEEYWRDKLKNEEQGLADLEKKLTATLEHLNKEESKFLENQQERINQFVAAGEKRQAAFEQRLKLINGAVKELEDSVNKRVERLKEQYKKAAALTVSLPPEQGDREYAMAFFAARYNSGRWAVFPPQLFGQRGVRGVLSGLLGRVNLPFRPASKTGEAMASRLQAMLPGLPLEGKLVEQNLLQDPGFIGDARAGLSELIDQGEINKKYASLFSAFDAGALKEQ